MEGKYEILKGWLQLHRGKEQIEIPVETLEERLREFDETFSFPDSAYKHAAWWGNDDSHPQARDGWLAAGWKAYPKVEDGRVVRVIFRRD